MRNNFLIWPRLGTHRTANTEMLGHKQTTDGGTKCRPLMRNNRNNPR